MDSSRPEVGSVAVVESEGRKPLAGERKQAAYIRTARALLWSSPNARPFIVSGALGSPLLYLLSKLPEGFLWGPIEVPAMSLGAFVALGSVVGILLFGGAVWVAGIIAPTPRYYLSVIEAWLMYRMGCIPPAVYFEHAAKLHAARLKAHLPAAAPTKRDASVLRTFQWRMASEAKQTQNPKRKQQSPKPKKTRTSGRGT